MKNRSIALYLSFIGLLLLFTAGWYVYAFRVQAAQSQPPSETPPIPTETRPAATNTPVEPDPSPASPPTPARSLVPFDGQRAYADMETQVAFGPRIPGTDGHARVRAWIADQLVGAGWQVEAQKSEAMGHPVINLIGKSGEGSPQIIVGAHYDSRILADHDPDPAKQGQPVPAANDGASGVAVLLELARSLPRDKAPTVWLVFFDAEDNGRIEGWDWILGSREFVKNNPSLQPRAVIVVDMIGDADLNIFQEANSNPALTAALWGTAEQLGYGSVFLPGVKHSLLDDHTPFLEAGLPAVDIIDFDYPYYHTTEDTPDKVSAESLRIVGETVGTWIVQQGGQN